jgi:hypothetical protein
MNAKAKQKLISLSDDYLPSQQECLVDPVTLKNVAKLFTGQAKPSLASVMGLFSLSEALVLFDRVISNGEWRIPGDLEEINLNFMKPVWDAVAIKEDLTSFSVYYGIPNDEAFDYAYNFCEALQDRFCNFWRKMGASPDSTKDTFTLEIADTLNVLNRAWKWKSNYLANPLWEMFFVMDEESTSSISRSLYSKLSESLKQEIAKLQEARYPAIMFIPPIPSLALAECGGDLSRFWFCISSLRKEFSGYRRKYSAYQNALSNPDNRSIGELIQIRRDAVSDIEKELNAISSKRADGRRMMELWDAVAKIEVGRKEEEITFGTGANLQSLLTYSLKELRSLLVRGRAKNLFKLRKKFLSISGYDELLCKNFGFAQKQLAEQLAAFESFCNEAKKATTDREDRDWAES